MFGMQVFRCVDADLQTEWSVKDGDCIRRGDTFGRVRCCSWHLRSCISLLALLQYPCRLHKHTGNACLHQ